MKRWIRWNHYQRRTTDRTTIFLPSRKSRQVRKCLQKASWPKKQKNSLGMEWPFLVAQKWPLLKHTHTQAHSKWCSWYKQLWNEQTEWWVGSWFTGEPEMQQQHNYYCVVNEPFRANLAAVAAKCPCQHFNNKDKGPCPPTHCTDQSVCACMREQSLEGMVYNVSNITWQHYTREYGFSFEVTPLHSTHLSFLTQQRHTM